MKFCHLQILQKKDEKIIASFSYFDEIKDNSMNNIEIVISIGTSILLAIKYLNELKKSKLSKLLYENGFKSKFPIEFSVKLESQEQLFFKTCLIVKTKDINKLVGRKIGWRGFSLIDMSTEKPVPFTPELFSHFDPIVFDFKDIPKQKSAEISVPFGGAVKKK